MESIIRTIMETFVVLSRFNDPRFDPDDACKHHEHILFELKCSCSWETAEMLLRVCHEMAEESRGRGDIERTNLLDSWGQDYCLVSTEDSPSIFESGKNRDGPEMSSDETIFRILVADIIFFFLREVEEAYAFHQLKRISNCLHRQDPGTIESFLAVVRKVSDEESGGSWEELMELLEAMSLGLDFLPDPDPV